MRKGFLNAPPSPENKKDGLGLLRNSRSLSESSQKGSNDGDLIGSASSDWKLDVPPAYNTSVSRTTPTIPETEASQAQESSLWGTPTKYPFREPNPFPPDVSDVDMRSSISSITGQHSQLATKQVPASCSGSHPAAAAASSTGTIPASSEATTVTDSTGGRTESSSAKIDPSNKIIADNFAPVYPHKTAEVPKAALNALYGKPPRRRPISADLYHTWHDSGPPHNLNWSSVFVCPLTREVFLSRVYTGSGPKPQGTRSEKDGLVWFKKKSLAEHGAAATAYDCCVFRDYIAAINPAQAPYCTLVAHELPYHRPERFTELPDVVPESIRKQVERQQAEIMKVQSTDAAPMQVDPAPKPTSAELAWEKIPPDDGMDETSDGGIFDDA